MGGIDWYISNAMFEVSMIIQNITVALSFVVLLKGIQKNLKSILFTLLHIAVLYAAIVLANLLISLLFVSMSSLIYMQLLILIIYVSFFCKYRIKTRIIVCSVYYATHLCLLALAGTLPHLLTLELMSDILSSIIRDFFVVLSLGIAFYIRYFNIEKHQRIPLIGVVLLIAFELFAGLLALLFFNMLLMNSNVIFNIFMCATFAGFTALGLLTYFMIYHICGEQSNIMQLQAEKQMLERNEEMIKLNQKNYEEMKTIRHDINNQCSYMQLMLSEKRYEELNKYFKNLYNEISKPVNFIDCGNRNISAILNLEIAKAQTEGVKIDTKIIVPPQFPFSDSDICSLLTNILDNAIEACVRNKIENPIIQAEIIQRQEYLFIYVTNPILGNLPQKNTTGFESSKKEKHLHGYGTKIIDKIAKKYNGQVKYSIKNNNFMVDVMLDLMINKSEEL